MVYCLGSDFRQRFSRLVSYGLAKSGSNDINDDIDVSQDSPSIDPAIHCVIDIISLVFPE